jgi:hypothetical protein
MQQQLKMGYKWPLASVLLMVAIAIGLAGCASSRRSSVAHPPPPAPTAPELPKATPIEIRSADLAKLHWIEGTWRGTGGDVPAFYERYQIEGNTLVVETLTDQTLSKVDDESRFELKDGHFGYTREDSGSVAVALDDNSITFAPVGKARNSFRWQRDTADSWKAILNWTDKDGNANERVYVMERFPANKP